MMTKQEKVDEIINRLEKIWPLPKTELNYTTALELLIATMLAAQARDSLVNKITPTLFAQYRTAQDYAQASVADIYVIIKQVNFAQTKAERIKSMAQMLLKDFNGEVPSEMNDLVKLPGVARKTANVVLGDAFHKREGIIVDTHVIRMARALGLTSEKDPVKIEQDLMAVVPRERWIDFSHFLTLFGRYYCPSGKNPAEAEILGDLMGETFF